MFHRWKTVSLGVACTVGLASPAAVQAECPCKRTNVFPVSQLAPIPMPSNGSAPMPTFTQGLPPAPPPSPSLNGVVPPTNLPPVPMPSLDAPPALTAPHFPPAPADQPMITPTPIVGDYSPITTDAPAAGTNRFGMSPPPGTLGRTYQQRSRIFDDEKHPRMAAVDVYMPEDVDISARGMKSVWTGKHWRLEAKDPLLPGVPHIYAIKAERKSSKGEVLSTDVRWIRLIPGRVVDLRF